MQRHSLTWFQQWLGMVTHAWPAVVLLSLMTTALHGVVHGDGWLMERMLNNGLLALEHLRGLNHDLPPRVDLVQLEAELVRNQLELPHLHLERETVERLSGVRPLDREQVASVLKQIGDGLAHRERLNVLAIDIDITPLVETDPVGSQVAADTEVALNPAMPDGPCETSACKAMLTAISSLRKRTHHLLLVAMARPTETSRRVRDRFLKQLADAERGEDLGEVRVVSSLIESRQGLVEKFHSVAAMGRRYQRPCDPPGVELRLPAYFPSLGVVAHELSGGASNPLAHTMIGPARSTSTATLPVQGIPPIAVGGLQPLIDDYLDDGTFAACIAERYAPNSYIDWASLKNGRVTLIGLTQAAGTSERTPKIDTFALQVSQARIMIVAADGGAGVDRHPTPFESGGMLPGALIHAAIAASDVLVPARTWASFLADLCAGLLYAGLWASTTLLVFARNPAPHGARNATLQRRAGWLVRYPALATALVLSMLLVLTVCGLKVRPIQLWDTVLAYRSAWLPIGLGVLLFTGGLFYTFQGMLLGARPAGLHRFPDVRRLLAWIHPLLCAFAVGSTAVAVNVAYHFLKSGPAYFFDLVPILVALLVHAYHEAATADSLSQAGRHDAAGNWAEQRKRFALALRRTARAAREWRALASLPRRHPRWTDAACLVLAIGALTIAALYQMVWH